MRDVPHVILLLYPNAGLDRGMLEGIVRYARTHGPWIFYLAGEEPGLPLPEFEAVSGAPVKTFQVSARQRVHLPDLRGWGVTGIIGRLQNRQIARLALNSGAPVIGMELSNEQLAAGQQSASLSEIKTDSYGAGRLAAEHLLERGFKNFGYCGYEGRGWSQCRQCGFTDRISEAGFTCHVYQTPIQKSTLLWQRERPDVLSWLGSLPKRVGVMACNDIRGRQLLEATMLGEMLVPDDVAVVGVDDDQLLCELSAPPLSSVKLDSEIGGYHAAELLDGLMSGRVRKPQQLVIEARCVVSRRSTDVIAVEDTDVATALRFIRERARKPIGVKDVVKHVLISRRGLEIRFQRTLGRSIREEIQRVKLDLTKQLLLETTMPVAKIADTVGFGSVSYMSKVFRTATGETLTQYRRRHLPS
jgi:LacI family transcriptional regulator